MKSLLATAAALAIAALVPPAGAATVSISCGSVGIEFQVCREGAEAWAQRTGNEVRLVSTPNATNERLALYQQLLAARSGDIDVFQIDVIWPGILGEHFSDLSDVVPKEELSKHFEHIVRNNTVDGKLVAMPWFTDAGIFYYRKDLLEKHGRQVPETWAEMEETAKLIQDKERQAGNQNMWGYVFQGKPYEGLTVVGLELINSHGGGTIVGPDGKVTVNNPKAVEALSKAAGWVNAISPQGVLNYSEEEARGVFQSGNAVFMRNWPYAWPLLNAADSPVKDKVGVATLPRGGEDGKRIGGLGGWQLAVSKYSRNQEAAKDLVRYLTSQEEQKRRAVVGAFNPTIPALYQDAEVIRANPFFKDLYGTFENAVARPSTVTGERYNQVSSEFWNTVNRVLAGQQQAGPALAQLDRTLDRLGRGGRW